MKNDYMYNSNLLKKGSVLAVVMALVLGMSGLAGCGSQNGAGNTSASTSETASSSASSSSTSSSSASSATTASYDFSYTDRDLDPSYNETGVVSIRFSGSSFETSSPAVSASNTGLKIAAGGVYKLSGTYSGTMSVEAATDEKVQLVLSGVDINGSFDKPAIEVVSADKVFVTLDAGTSNTISDTGMAAEGEEENAAIWSACDLTVQGEGTLSVNGNRSDGIKSKDDLTITGGTLFVNTKSDAIVGHDSIKITKATVEANAQEGDALKSSEADKDDKGFVSIDDGNMILNSSADNGIAAARYVRLAGGNVTITAGNDGINSDLDAIMEGGTVKISAEDDGIHSEYNLTVTDGVLDVSKSYEGLEAQSIWVKGGTSSINANDDGLNASPAGNSSVESSDTATNPFTGEHSDSNGQQHPMMNNEQPPSDMPEGQRPEAGTGQPSDSNAPSRFKSRDESANPPASPQQTGNASASQALGDVGFRGGPGGMMDTSEDCSLIIDGGYLYVNAKGDGLDSNGTIEINDGTVLVNGPDNNGNAAIDAGLGATVNGGNLVSIGTSGMYEGLSKGNQSFIESSVSIGVGESVALVKDGMVVASLTAARKADHVVASAPSLKEGDSYELVVGGTIVGADEHGYISDGKLTVDGSSTQVEAVSESSGSNGKVGRMSARNADGSGANGQGTGDSPSGDAVAGRTRGNGSPTTSQT